MFFQLSLKALKRDPNGVKMVSFSKKLRNMPSDSGLSPHISITAYGDWGLLPPEPNLL